MIGQGACFSPTPWSGGGSTRTWPSHPSRSAYRLHIPPAPLFAGWDHGVPFDIGVERASAQAEAPGKKDLGVRTRWTCTEYLAGPAFEDGTAPRG